MATVGELLVVFRASTGAFTRDLEKVNKLSFDSAKEIERSFKRIGAVVATELVAAAGAVTVAVAKTLDNADKMGKMAKQVALTTEEFTSLAYAANITDVSIDTLTTSLLKMEQNLEKSNEQTLEGKAAHSALATLFRGNIPVFLDANDAFVKISQRLSELPNQMQRAALQQQIFGRGSKDMTELILSGADGIAKLRAEAQQFGVVIGDRTAKAANEFNDTLKKIHIIVDGLLVRLAENLLPNLQKLADQFLANAKNAVAFQERVGAVANGVRVLASGVLILAGAFNVVGNAAATAAVALGVYFGFSDLAQLKESAKLTGEAWTGMVNSLKSIWSDLDNKSSTTTTDIKQNWKGLVTVSDDLDKAFKSTVESLSQELYTLESSADAWTLYKLKLLGAKEQMLAIVETMQRARDEQKNFKEEFLDPWEKLIVLNRRFSENLDATAKSLDEFSSKEFDKLQSEEDMYTKLIYGPLADYYDKVNQLNDLNAQGVITNEQLANAIDLLNHQFGLVSVSVAKTVEWSKLARKEFEKMFTDAIFGAKSFRDALADMVNAFARIIFQALVLEPLMDSLFGKAKAGGGSSGGLLGGFFSAIGSFFGFGGGKAEGGSVYPGRSYIIGEKGPELFYPSVAGMVIPNGAGGQTVYQIDARGADPTVEFRIRRALQETESRAVQRSVVATREMQLRNV